MPADVHNSFLATLMTPRFSRQAGGNWVQILFSGYTELSDISVQAVGRDVMIHEIQLIDENNELIQVNDLSEIRVRRGVKAMATGILENGVLKGINIRAESMGGPASLSIRTHSQDQIQLSNR
jgi:hypothetical protein